MLRTSCPVMCALLAVAACGLDQNDPAPTDPSMAAAPICAGADIPADPITARLELASDDTVAVQVHNHGTTPRTVTVTVHAHRGDALARASAAAIDLAAGADAIVAVALAEVGVDRGTSAGLKAEVTSVGADGAIARTFAALAFAGGSTARRVAPTGAATVDGEPAVIAAEVRGGAGVDLATLGGALDEVAAASAARVITLPGGTFDMCFRWPVSLVDAGFGEDFGVDPTDPWRARGGRAKVYQGGVARFDGYLDDEGCTGPFAAPGSNNFSIFGYSRARIDGNDVIVRDGAGATRSFVIWDADPGANQTPTYVFPEIDQSTMLAVAAFTVQRIDHGLTGQTITLDNRCQPGGCCDCATTPNIWISARTRKFLIAHELGHALLSLKVGAYNNDVSFDLDPSNKAALCDTASSHGMWSMEFESGAAMEGWAHFVAATAFNSTAGTNPGAAFRYWAAAGDTSVDVEQGPTGGAANYFDTVCPGVVSATKLSVELDWLRHWWDYATNATGVDPGARPSWTQLTDEIDVALPWSAGTTWSQLGASIESVSGSEQRARWDQHGAWNGVD